MPLTALLRSCARSAKLAFSRSGVAQLAARMILVHEVGGSSPPPRADALSQRGDTVTELAWQKRERWQGRSPSNSTSWSHRLVA
jgi:hypothetical protein